MVGDPWGSGGDVDDRVGVMLGAIAAGTAVWAMVALTFGASLGVVVGPFLIASGFVFLAASAEGLAEASRLPPVGDAGDDPALAHGRGIRRTGSVVGSLVAGALGLAVLVVGTWALFGGPAVDLPFVP